MNTPIKSLLLSTVLAAGLVAQNEPPKASPSTPPKAAETAPVAKDAEKWIKQLGSESYRDRLQAEKKLRELGEAARPALERAAADDSDREAQWRSKRLLRQLDEGIKPGLQERRPDAQAEPELQEPRARRDQHSVDELREEFDRVFRRFERDFGIDVPRFRFFDDSFFRDLRSQLQTDSNQRGMSMQVGPDGVHVEITEVGKDGKVETKTYDAPDLETFERLHPGVLKKNGLGLGLELRGFDLDDLPRVRALDLDRLQPRGRNRDTLRPRAEPAAPVPAEGRRLGVVVKPLPEAVREYLDLDQGVGLMVASVQDDTLAAAAGLEPNDIIVAINDHKIGAPADVADALGAIDKGEKVRIEFVRKGRHQQAEVTKRHAAAPGREKLPAKPRSRGTIR